MREAVRFAPPEEAVSLIVTFADLSFLSLRATERDGFSVTVAVPALLALPLPEAIFLVPSLRAVALSAVAVPETVHAAAQGTLTFRPLAANLASLASPNVNFRSLLWDRPPPARRPAVGAAAFDRLAVGDDVDRVDDRLVLADAAVDRCRPRRRGR